MKKHFGSALVVLVLAVPAFVFAAEFRSGDQPSVGVNESIGNDVYMAGGGVTSMGTILGDLVAGGGSVTIGGYVSGDVAVGGGNITILSDIGDDLRAGGGNIALQGKVKGDVVVGGGQVNVGGPGVGGDVVIGGGLVRIDAPIGGNIRIGGGNIYIDSQVDGDILIYEADKVTLGKNARINGDIKYKAREELTKVDGAVVNGKVSYEPSLRREVSLAIFAGLISLWVVGRFLALLISALVIGLVFRRYAREVIDRVTARPLLELGRGLAVFVMLPTLAAVMFVTVLGIPFGILGVLAFIILMMFSCIVASIVIGSIVYRYFSKSEPEVSWKTILVGVLIFEVLNIIPLLGWVTQSFFVLVTLGAIVAIKWQIAREWR